MAALHEWNGVLSSAWCMLLSLTYSCCVQRPTSLHMVIRPARQACAQLKCSWHYLALSARPALVQWRRAVNGSGGRMCHAKSLNCLLNDNGAAKGDDVLMQSFALHME